MLTCRTQHNPTHIVPTGDAGRDIAAAWKACATAAAWADMAVLPASWVPSTYGCASIAAQQSTLSAELRLAIAGTCGRSLTVTDSTGAVVLATDTGQKVGRVAVRAGNLVVGVLTESLWSPIAARELMLGGAELLIAPTATVAATAEEAELQAALLQTRGFENAAAVVRVNHAAPRGDGGSALANWYVQIYMLYHSGLPSPIVEVVNAVHYTCSWGGPLHVCMGRCGLM